MCSSRLQRAGSLGLALLVGCLVGAAVWFQIQLSATLSAVQRNREVALRVTCAVESAVAQAGRTVIAGDQPPPPTEEKALEALGFPPFRVRLQMQERAADAYVAGIAARIERQVGSKGDGLVLPGGRINCDRLVQIAHPN